MPRGWRSAPRAPVYELDDQTQIANSSRSHAPRSAASCPSKTAGITARSWDCARCASASWITTSRPGASRGFYYGSNLDEIKLGGDAQSQAGWFNTAGFERDRNKQPSAFHVRVFPREFGLRADAAHALDANLARNFALSERHQLQFRADFLNLPNNVQWGLPSTDPTNNNFGKATTQRNAPRLIQFQLRYSF